MGVVLFLGEFSVSMVSSGISDVAFVLVHSEKTPLKKLIMISIISFIITIIMKKLQEI